jgi:phospholipid/cholesterol/gamma-HCH transport system substrate-binding protein
MPAMGKRDLKVGLFVLAGLFLAVVVVFLLGNERRLFDQSVTFKTSFHDVQGLKPGAPVRMGGIDIGQVSDVGYSKKDPKDTTIYVKFWVSTMEASRVKADSKATISTKGLLGDKMIEITMGESAAVAEPGSELEGAQGPDMMGKINGAADKAEEMMDNISKAAKPLADEKLHKDIQGSVASMNTILGEVAHGQGYPNRLLTDKNEADRISRTLDNLEKTTHEAELTLQQVRGVVARVQQGPGFAHDVIYGDGPKGLAEFSNAANEVALTLKGVREGDGIAHDMLYGGKGGSQDALKNVTAMTADLRAIVADLRAGKGTIGGLLVDPSVYEDVKVVLGNVQRNDVLRSLVRYSINQDEKKTEVKVAGPGPQ